MCVCVCARSRVCVCVYMYVSNNFEKIIIYKHNVIIYVNVVFCMI